MPKRHLDATRRAKAVRYLLLQWQPKDIAQELRCTVIMIYTIRKNLLLYGSLIKPRRRILSRPRAITPADGARLLEFLTRNPTADQQEMLWFLWEECNLYINQSTVSRWLKAAKWSSKKARRSAMNASLDLRRGYLAEMVGITAEQMVFIDESLFNETTGWRLTAWAPIGQEGRYYADRTCGRSWSLLAAYTTEGYLKWRVKEGYHNTASFYQWLIEELLPQCQPFPGPNSVIIMDNASIHCHPMIADAIRA